MFHTVHPQLMSSYYFSHMMHQNQSSSVYQMLYSLSYGVSVGFGLPLVDNRSLVNVSFEYTKINPSGKNMIDEQYFRFTVNYTFNEMWFWKKKVD